MEEENGRVPSKKKGSQSQGFFNDTEIGVELMLQIDHTVIRIAVKGL